MSTSEHRKYTGLDSRGFWTNLSPAEAGMKYPAFAAQGATGFDTKVRRLIEEGASPATNICEYEARLVRRILSEVSAMGARPLLVLAPGIEKTRFPFAAFQRLENVPQTECFDYLQPAVYPSLYQFDCYWSANHLVPEAAVVFTELFARDFSHYLERRHLNEHNGSSGKDWAV
jgi:hypothetical protein